MKKLLIVSLFAVMATVVFTGCEKTKHDGRTVEIMQIIVASEAATHPITGAYIYSVKFSTSDGWGEWQEFDHEITGFEYEEGYEYVLSIRKTTYADKPDVDYSLIGILSKTEDQDSGGED